MTHFVLLLITGVLIAGNAWADNSRFFGVFTGSVIACNDEIAGTVIIANDAGQISGPIEGESTVYLYMPLDGNSYFLSNRTSDGDPVTATLSINGNMLYYSDRTWDESDPSRYWTIEFTVTLSDDGKTVSISGNMGSYDDDPDDCNGRITGSATRTLTKPDSPVLRSPADSSTGVSLTQTLTVGTFSDPDPGDVHWKTEWQISTDTGFSSLILGQETDSLLTAMTIPDTLLQGNTTYYWRVRFYDDKEMASDWSTVYSFTTTPDFTDENSNGIPDELENQTVDMNNDGISDIQQSDVIKSLNTVIGNGQMGVSVEGQNSAVEIATVNSIDPASISEYERPHTMPLGMLSFRVAVSNPGDTVSANVYFSEPAPENASWFFHDAVNGWSDYSQYVTFSSDRKSATVELRDGGHGDSDGIANGIISDPCGFGIASWLKGKIRGVTSSQAVSKGKLFLPALGLNTNALPDGQYIMMVPPGTYDMTVSAAGYEPKTVNTIDVSEADIVTENIQLLEKIKINGLTISGTRQEFEPVMFTVSAEGKASTLYYRFSVHPDYGTDGYDGTRWVSMTSTEWVTTSSARYSFSANGKYIVVVWVTADPENFDISGVATLGTSIEIGGTCATELKSVGITGNQVKDSPISIALIAGNSCAENLYYRYSVHPYYGTSGYDGTHWTSMTPLEWWSRSPVDYTFTEKGKYIVVVWATSSLHNTDPGGIPIMGWSMDIE